MNYQYNIFFISHFCNDNKTFYLLNNYSLLKQRFLIIVFFLLLNDSTSGSHEDESKIDR